MRTLAKSLAEMPKTLNYQSINFDNSLDVELIDFSHIKNNYKLSLKIFKIDTDNYRIFIKGCVVKIIVAEPQEYLTPVHIHNINWEIYSKQSYDIIKHADIWLPGDNFFLIKHIAYPKDEILEVILGNSKNE